MLQCLFLAILLFNVTRACEDPRVCVRLGVVRLGAVCPDIHPSIQMAESNV